MARTRMNDQETQSDHKKILVKAYLNEDEHRLLRHAAAEKGQNISDFIKEVILLESQNVMDEFLARALEKRSQSLSES